MNENIKPILDTVTEAIADEVPILNKILKWKGTYRSITDQLFLDKLERILLGAKEPMTEDKWKIFWNKFREKMKDKDDAYQFMLNIERINEIGKCHYFSNLIRCSVFNSMDNNLFQILWNIIASCNIPCLQYLERQKVENPALKDYFSTSLYYYGLFEPEDTGKEECEYKMTSLGKLLKDTSLNYNGLEEEMRLPSPNQLPPVDVAEPISNQIFKCTIPGLD